MTDAKIYKSIIGVMSEIGAIGKGKTNTQQGFKYRGVDDVMNALQPLLVKHGVFVVPEIVEQTREDRTSRNGAALIYSVCRIKYTFYAEDGSSVTAITIGEGMDSGDKATNKAMAIAFKYACFQVFCIPTEEMKDPDADSPELGASPHPNAPPTNTASGDTISEAQIKRMFAISKADRELCLEVTKKFGYNNSREIRKADYEKICAEIAARVA